MSFSRKRDVRSKFSMFSYSIAPTRIPDSIKKLWISICIALWVISRNHFKKNVISLLNRISNSTTDELAFARFVFSNGSAEMIKFMTSQGKKQSK